jgi:hypothetical protein
MAKTDYYELLGISKDASAEENKKAYRKMAVKYYSDKSFDKEIWGVGATDLNIYFTQLIEFVCCDNSFKGGTKGGKMNG